MGIDKKLKLAVFVSGRGSNLQAIIDACENPNFPAQISVVVSNVPDAFGLERAQSANIETAVVNHKDYDGRESFEAALQEELGNHDVDLICLAGFMRILTAGFIDQWPEKIINIHPSLLPKHKGLNTHQRAIDVGDDMSGCTVHYVVPEMDSGPIIVQKSVPILDNDNEETLAARVLEQEHIAYPEAIELIAQEHLKS